MKDNHTEIEVTEILDCDFCAMEHKIIPAVYDCKTIMSSWANLCQSHYDEYGSGLGLGKGQKLILKV